MGYTYSSYEPLIIAKLKDNSIFNDFLDTTKKLENQLEQLKATEEQNPSTVNAIKELEKELSNYKNEESKIQEAISKLKTPAKEIIEERVKAQTLSDTLC